MNTRNQRRRTTIRWFQVLLALAVLLAAIVVWGISRPTSGAPETKAVSSVTPTSVIQFSTGATKVYSDIPSLKRASDIVVVGTISAKLGYTESGELVQTIYQLDITKVVSDPQGLLSGLSSIKIQQPGGLIGDKLYENSRDPLFNVGDREVLFLATSRIPGSDKFATVGGPYGRFDVRNGVVIPRASGGVPVNPNTTEDQFVAEIQAVAMARAASHA